MPDRYSPLCEDLLAEFGQQVTFTRGAAMTTATAIFVIQAAPDAVAGQRASHGVATLRLDPRAYDANVMGTGAEAITAQGAFTVRGMDAGEGGLLTLSLRKGRE